MSYLNKVWMAASFVAVQGNADHGVKLKSGEFVRLGVPDY
jgi:hypothetical protein